MCKAKIGAVLHELLAVGGECFLACPLASCHHFSTSSGLPVTGDNNPGEGGENQRSSKPAVLGLSESQ